MEWYLDRLCEPSAMPPQGTPHHLRHVRTRANGPVVAAKATGRQSHRAACWVTSLACTDEHSRPVSKAVLHSRDQIITSESLSHTTLTPFQHSVSFRGQGACLTMENHNHSQKSSHHPKHNHLESIDSISQQLSSCVILGATF